MNVKLFSGTIGIKHHKFVIVRFGWFGFGSWHTRAIHYSEYRLGCFLVKVNR